MNPIAIVAIIGMVVASVWAGISSVVYNLDGSTKIPLLGFMPRFPIDFSEMPQPTMINSTNETSFDYGNWIKSVPINGVIDYLTGGTGAIISWITPAVQNLFQSLVWAFCKTCGLPSFFGILVTVLILVIFFVMMWSQLWELFNKFGIILLVVVVMIIVIVVVMSLLGVLH